MSSTVPPTMPPSSGSPETNGSAPPSLYSTRFKIVAAVLVTLAVAAFVAAYLQTSGEDEGTASGDFVERLLPGRDSQAMQQGTVGIDLAPGWDGTLVVDGTAIPEDELEVTEALNLVEFTPGPGKTMESLRVGKVCAQATVWQISRGRDSARVVSWCFDVI